MKKEAKSKCVTFHVNPIEDENKDRDVYIFIPRRFWGTQVIKKEIKEVLDIVFFDETEAEQN